MPGHWLLGGIAGQGSATADGGRPRAVLLGVAGPPDGADEVSLAELARLADTDGLDVVGELMQHRPHPDPATYVGAGKVTELAALVADRNAGVVVADGELTPGQVRNLEEGTGARVVDRTAVILDIFAEHARSSEGKIQVELAQLAYQLPRLRGGGQQLSRVGGGRVAGGAGMGVRGPGEQRLERERRRLRRRMTALREQIRDIGSRRETTRRRRVRNRVPAVALTGYTNAGKSSLLNRLTGAEVLVEDALFATLDPTVRRVTAPDGTAALRRAYPDAVAVSARTGEGVEQLRDAIVAALRETGRQDPARAADGTGTGRRAPLPSKDP